MPDGFQHLKTSWKLTGLKLFRSKKVFMVDTINVLVLIVIVLFPFLRFLNISQFFSLATVCQSLQGVIMWRSRTFSAGGCPKVCANWNSSQIVGYQENPSVGISVGNNFPTLLEYLSDTVIMLGKWPLDYTSKMN